MSGNNADVVANALKLEDNPPEGVPELDPENAQLLKLFEETTSDVPEDEEVETSESPPEDGAESPLEDTASPEVDSTVSDTAPTEPPPEPSPATEPELTPNLAKLETPEAVAVPTGPTTEERAEWRKGAVEKVQKYYETQLEGDEMRDLLLTEPEKALPGILANAYMDMYDSLMGGVSKSMPAHVQNILQTQKTNQAQEVAFFDKWPKLKEAYSEDDEKRGVITRSVQMYRQANPQATVQQAIDEAGASAMVALRIPIGDVAGHPVTPASKGFAPAAPGGGAQVSTPPKPPKVLNEFEKLAEELLADEEV